MTRLSLVVAVAENGVIGHEGALPWRLPADLAHFKRLTLGKPVIMGRKTFESIGRPLDGRRNIVVTRRADWRATGVETAGSFDAALALVAGQAEAMVIGGADIYRLALPRARRIHLTRIHAEPEGDTHFPPLDLRAWQETAREDHPAEGDRPAFSFITLERRG